MKKLSFFFEPVIHDGIIPKESEDLLQFSFMLPSFNLRPISTVVEAIEHSQIASDNMARLFQKSFRFKRFHNRFTIELSQLN